LIEPFYQSDRVTLYNADCLAVLPQLAAGSVDAVVTDPPYGIGKALVRGGGGGGWKNMVNSGADKWDVRPSSEVFEQIFRVSQNQIVWGGNYFGLPPCEKPLCWDKVRPNQKNASEWEYAWTSMRGRAQLFKHCANGGFILKEPRQHPTQKPLPLMEWCIGFFKESKTILDPFMGSGTTGVAAIKTGRKFVGIELDAGYCEIAKKRIMEAEAAQ
jgi:site-specific DNA-methyltransferase (adenine-specific)/modification methylase